MRVVTHGQCLSIGDRYCFDCPLKIWFQYTKFDGSCASGTGLVSMLFSSTYCLETSANAHLPASSIATQESRIGRDPDLTRCGSSPRRPNGLVMPPHLSARLKKLAPLLSAGTRQPVSGLAEPRISFWQRECVSRLG